MALYGAPVWAGDLENCRAGRELLPRVHRHAVLRAVRAYRTVVTRRPCRRWWVSPFSSAREDGGGGLLRLPRSPWSEEPPLRRMELRCGGQAWRRNGSRWIDCSLSPNIGRDASVGALLPILAEWVRRTYGRLTFRLTQMITGVGVSLIICVA